MKSPDYDNQTNDYWNEEKNQTKEDHTGQARYSIKHFYKKDH